jgi:hypothetical protein
VWDNGGMMTHPKYPQAGEIPDECVEFADGDPDTALFVYLLVKSGLGEIVETERGTDT